MISLSSAKFSVSSLSNEARKDLDMIKDTSSLLI